MLGLVVGVNLLGEGEEGEYSSGSFDESLYRNFHIKSQEEWIFLLK